MAGYYLHTLEGVARTFGAALSLVEEFNNLFYKHRNAGLDIGPAVFRALQNVHALHPLDDLTDVYNYLYSLEGKNNLTGYIEIVNNFISLLSRQKQQAQAQAQASDAAAAYKAAMDRKKQEEEDAAAIEAEERRIIAAQRAEQDASEQAAAYREAVEATTVEETPAATMENEVKNMDELAYLNFQQKISNSDNVNLPEQYVTGGHEYTIIDEDNKTISYTDETGKLYIEPKVTPVWPWIIAAVAGFVLLG